MKVVVVGGGKVGFYLAQTLMEHGHEPHLIEKDKKTCARVADMLDIPIICGDGTMIDVLNSAGINDADALIGVTGQDENNLIACQLAKRCDVRRTVARVNNPKNGPVMKELGVDIPISSTENIARLLEREVDTCTMKQLISLNGGEASLSEVLLPAHYHYHGKTLSQLAFTEDLVFVSITRNGELIIPRGNTQPLSGDKILILAKNTLLHKIQKLLMLE